MPWATPVSCWSSPDSLGGSNCCDISTKIPFPLIILFNFPGISLSFHPFLLQICTSRVKPSQGQELEDVCLIFWIFWILLEVFLLLGIAGDTPNFSPSQLEQFFGWMALKWAASIPCIKATMSFWHKCVCLVEFRRCLGCATLFFVKESTQVACKTSGVSGNDWLVAQTRLLG